MLEKAIAVAGVKPEYSFFVGDSIRDVKAAHKAGIRGFCVPSNTNLNDFFDDHQF
jgi:histidinol phosphatase-like enzyme